MDGPVTEDTEVLAVSCLADHGSGIAAYGHRFAGDKTMVVVKDEVGRLARDSSLVRRDLTVVFANILEILKFESPNCKRIKVDHPGLGFNLSIVETDTPPGNNPVVRTSRLVKDPAEIGVGPIETEATSLGLAVAAGDLDLLLRHVDAYNESLRTDEEGSEIGVPSGPTTEIQHTTSLQVRRYR